ncbi:hypothetical protein ACFWNH_12615 [Rhodococcus qingshengii]|uniref:TY-Chap domain-containing protein n=1 Tax=Rhodococcus qingshengii TaxID=334542 RepID=UPI0006D023D8|nr:hypothetical protein [Rhodococcus qingshengii]QPG89180.1 hypothetical protein I1G86_25910 [Rhodococcus qingshengii]
MTAEGWEKLQAAIPDLVDVDFDDDAEPIQISQFVRLRDSGTGRDITVYENGGAVEATLTIPSDPDAAQQLLSVLQTQPVWFQTSNEQRLETSRWSPTHSEPSELREISASVVAIMRDGLGMEFQRIRYTAGDETGYNTGPWALRNLLTAEQPTKRGAPDRCTDWTDFAERLEWVVRIMPGYDIVTLDAPAVKDLGSIQFQQDNGRLEASMITADTVPGSGGLDLRLRALGWRVTEGPGAPHVEWLYGPFSSSAGFVDRRLDRIPQLTVDTFRTVHGVNSPQDLAVSGHEETVVNGHQAHISRELGIPCLPYTLTPP